jgi:hypothetical protein
MHYMTDLSSFGSVQETYIFPYMVVFDPVDCEYPARAVQECCTYKHTCNALFQHNFSNRCYNINGYLLGFVSFFFLDAIT